MKMKSASQSGIKRRPILVWAGVFMLALLLAACTGAETEPALTPADIEAEEIPAIAQTYIEMSQAALAEQLNVAPEAISLESITEPPALDGTFLIRLTVDGQVYEFHGRDDEVLLVSDPLPTAPAGEADYIYNTALVDSATLLVDEPDPAAVHVVVNGNLRNGCEALHETAVTMAGETTIAVKISTRQPTNMMCTEALVPFTHTVSLAEQLATLPAGEYEVVVNDSVSIPLNWSGSELVPQPTDEGLDIDEPMDTAVYSSADLVSKLEAAGATVRLSTEPEPAAEIFSVPGQFINVGSERIQLYVYDDAQAASLDASRVSPSGQEISAEDGSVMMVEWAGTPHFYRYGNLLVLYVGEDNDTLALLETVLGAPFAGG